MWKIRNESGPGDAMKPSSASERARRILEYSLKLRELLRRRDIVDILEAILDTSPPLKLTAIASKLSTSVDAIRRKLRIIKNARINIRVDINHYGMGLLKLIVMIYGILDKIPAPLSYILKWKAYILSPRPITMLIFYQPVNVNEKLILNTLEQYKIIKFFKAQLTIYNKPKFSRYFDPRTCKFIYPWNEIKNKIEMNLSFLRPPTPTFFKRLDWLDVLIISVLEDNALIGIGDIAKRLHVPRNRISSHYKNHLLQTGIVRGFSLAYAPFPLEGSFYIIVYMKGDIKKIYPIVSTIRELVGFGSANLDIENGNAICAFVLPYDVLSGFIEFLNWLRKYVDDIEVYVVDRLSVKSYSVPFFVYSPEARFWDLNVYEYMKEKFEKLFQRK